MIHRRAVEHRTGLYEGTCVTSCFKIQNGIAFRVGRVDCNRALSAAVFAHALLTAAAFFLSSLSLFNTVPLHLLKYNRQRVQSAQHLLIEGVDLDLT